MEILHQYYYHKSNVVIKAVGNAILAVLFVGFGVYSYVHWELSFLFTDWHGYVILGVYGLITLGTILSAVELFKKVSKSRRSIPALAVGADFLIVYDNAGLSTTIPFEDCENVRFKTNYRYRGAPPTLTLIVKYHNKQEPDNTLSLEIDLSELDRPQREIDKELNKVYKKYKKEHEGSNE